jgi:adenylyl-sulfate kinase
VCTDVILTDPETLCRSGTDRLVENDLGRARFALDAPLLADTYRQNRDFGSLVVVSTETRETLGAALIVDTLDTETHAKAPNGVSPETTSAGTKVTSRERAALLRQVPMTVWLTGLSGSGKSTIAGALERRLVDAGHAAFVLDGDSLRLGLCRDLGFSPRDRAENIRRVAEVARLMNDAGVLVIGALISPYRKDRASAGEIIGPDRFLEVHVCTPLEVCERRDPKGMYRRARANRIAGFTGVGAPYEPPEQPDLALDTQHLSVEECVQRLVRLIEARGRD